MPDFTKLNTALNAVKTTLVSNMVSADYKHVIVDPESSKLFEKTNYPLCALLLDDGQLSNNSRVNLNLHVVGLFFAHKGQNLIKTTTDTMEKTIAYLRENHRELVMHDPVQIYINQNVLDPWTFGYEFPLLPPLGGFRLMFPNFHTMLDTNTT